MSTLRVNNMTNAGGTGPTYASGMIIQTVSTTKSDVFSTTSTSFVDITGLSAAITPKSASSKILVTVSLSLLTSQSGYISGARILRDSTVIGAGNAEGSRYSASFSTNSLNGVNNLSHQFLDSPSSTSLTTYKVQLRIESGATGMINYSIPTDVNSVNVPRLASTITVQEVAA